MAWLLVPIGILVGSLIHLQGGINASLRNHIGSPVLAAIVNFAVGGALLVGYAVATRQPLPSSQQIESMPWWGWVGGSMGAALVLMGVLASHRLGAGTTMACIILGQLSASVVLDHFGLVGYTQHAVNPMRLLGLGLLGAGVYVIRTN